MEETRHISSEINESKIFGTNSKELLPILALLAAVFLWGGSFAGMRVALKTLNPWTVMWCRMITALILILPLAGKLMPNDYKKGDWKLLIPMVLFQPCLYFLLESNALRFTTSSQAGVISASVPVMVTLGAFLFLSEAISKKTVAGLFLSVAGVVILTMGQDNGGLATNPVLGNTLEICAMVCAAANMLIIKQLSNRYNPWTLTAMQVVAGTIFFIPGLYFMLKTDISIWSSQLVYILIFLGAFVTLGAFGLYNWGISRIAASKASSFINLVPVTAVFIGWVVLGETLSMFQCIAASAVIIGVLLSQNPNS